MDAQKKIALITGAAKGIGLETARQLGRQGFTVLLGVRDQARAQAAADQLKSEGIDAHPLQLDLDNPADHTAAAEFIQREFDRLDVLINNAGIMPEGMGRNQTSTLAPAILRQTFETNFFSLVALTQTLIPLLKKSPAGRIVNVSSILGSLSLAATKGSPTYTSKIFAYNTSKAALNSFTIHLAHELRPTKIKVNSAHPGWVKTDMGTSAAPMEIVDGAKTEVALATLPDDGPSGGFFHLGEPIAW